MTKRMIAPLIFGVCGIAVLLSLGFWQLERLKWKEGIIAAVEQRLDAPPQALQGYYTRSDADDPAPNYTRVIFEGRKTQSEAHVYAPQKEGLGYRIVSEFWWQGKNLFVDLGWVNEAQKNAQRGDAQMRITGYISRPDDYDPSFTPEPDLEKNIFFSRHVPPMAQHLGVTPFLVVAQKVEILEEAQWQDYTLVTPSPISPKIKNDHFEYAVTWFLLALVWFGMTAYLLWRIKRKTV